MTPTTRNDGAAVRLTPSQWKVMELLYRGGKLMPSFERTGMFFGIHAARDVMFYLAERFVYPLEDQGLLDLTPNHIALTQAGARIAAERFSKE